jgi:hypothetical protein
MRLRNVTCLLACALATRGGSIVYAQERVAESIVTLEPSTAPSFTPDPDPTKLSPGAVKELRVSGIPIGSRILRVQVFCRESDINTWAGPCPVHSTGKFLDCGGLPPQKPVGAGKDFGWLRVIPAQHQQGTTPKGIEIWYNTAFNWSADRTRVVKLTVHYLPPAPATRPSTSRKKPRPGKPGGGAGPPAR